MCLFHFKVRHGVFLISMFNMVTCLSLILYFIDIAMIKKCVSNNLNNKTKSDVGSDSFEHIIKQLDILFFILITKLIGIVLIIYSNLTMAATTRRVANISSYYEMLRNKEYIKNWLKTKKICLVYLLVNVGINLYNLQIDSMLFIIMFLYIVVFYQRKFVKRFYVDINFDYIDDPDRLFGQQNAVIESTSHGSHVINETSVNSIQDLQQGSSDSELPTYNFIFMPD